MRKPIDWPTIDLSASEMTRLEALMDKHEGQVPA